MNEFGKYRIKKFSIVKDYTLSLTFADGKSQIVDLRNAIGRGMYEPMLDKKYFARVRLNESGLLEWPDGQDFNPEALYNWDTQGKHYEFHGKPVAQMA